MFSPYIVLKYDGLSRNITKQRCLQFHRITIPGSNHENLFLDTLFQTIENRSFVVK